jgi:rhodanese-related sulfurtransferase
MAIGLSLVGLALGGLGWHQPSVQPVAEKNGLPGTPGHVSPLSAIETVIKLAYSDIGHLSPDALLTMEGKNDRLVLLDAREAEEFEVSRIPGAVRIDPEATPQQFLAAAGDPSGKTIVVYCSVGARSSTLVRRVRDRLQQRGAKGVYNLSGGIFRWHNEQRHLVDDAGGTDFVHEFDGYWGQLVLRQDLAVPGPARSRE